MIMKKFYILAIVAASFSIAILDPQKAFAENAPSRTDFNNWLWDTLPNFSAGATTTPGQIIGKVLPYIYYGSGFAVLLYAVLGGFEVMISQGDPKKIASGREKITYAIIGFIILFIAYAVVRLIGMILDIQQIRQIFGPFP